MNKLEISLLSLIFFHTLKSCISIDSITPTQPVSDGDIILSKGEIFALGFFSPGNSAHRYVGIWYNNISEQTVVWVANRDNPINGISGILTLNTKGNLVIYENNKTNIPLWSAKANVTTTSSKAELLDSGNLVLLDQNNGNETIWESFDYPTDTTVPTMKLGMNKKTGKNWFISSWKSRDDPGTGNIFLKINPVGFPQVFMYNGSVPLWRGGPWTGQRWNGVTEMIRGSQVFKPKFVNNEEEISITYNFINSVDASLIITRKIVNESGILQQLAWAEDDWIKLWSGPKDSCDKYGKCGANSNCYTYDSGNFTCKCLPGFVSKLNGSGECVRKTGVSTCQSGEGFVRVENVKLPDTSVALANMNMNLEACEEECLKNCSCTAYTSADERGYGCLSWFGDLIDTKNYSNGGQQLFLRVDAAELGNSVTSRGSTNKRWTIIIIVSVSVISFLSVFGIYCLIKKRRNARDKTRRRNYLFSLSKDTESGNGDDNEGAISELPFFDLNVLAEATNDFSEDNKLGKGGFGSVYKGLLPGGKEIAVKRLSKFSGQGSEEFKNEVALIAKLQHRNLVRMLGYCIHGEEKMLIYEFLPNKSLDTFIFDKAKGSLLNWPMRHEIICEIARGILYLHQDSRLRIIHRDLKASNILLDASMKPKISDFGMAKICRTDQIEGATHRIVGTYGYMAPEYAMQGQFSVKSDVYSFGILLLEIITGRKNSSFYNEIRFSNLPGYVWELWKEGRSIEIVDESLGKSNPQEEIERCIQIGLLCVQEAAIDRPNMYHVVLMLSNDTILASPKQPAFILTTDYSSYQYPSATSGGTSTSINSITESILHPR